MGSRDTSALISSFKEHYDGLLRFLARRTGDVERAADVAQDTYLRLVDIDPAQTLIDNERAYIYRVARNLAVDTMRRESRLAAWQSGGEDEAVIADSAPSPERVMIGRDRLEHLNAALAALPPKARLALLMFRVDGLSHAQIATRLKVSESMVAKYIAQALRHCRDRLWRIDQK